MPVTLLASQCPAVPCPATFLNPAAGTPVVASALVPGDKAELLTKFNLNAGQLDALGRAGAGCYGVAFGLAISAGAGLTLNVAAGQAVMDGLATLPSGGTITLPDNTARCYLWIARNGALQPPVSNSLTPPAGTNVFLGSAVTSGGAITSVDSSGVCYLLAGVMARDTADTTTPSDTPPAGVILLTRGTSDDWLWDGRRYVQLSSVAAALSLFGATIGASGTPITQVRVYTPNLTPAALAASVGFQEQPFTVTGLTTADKVFVNGPAPAANAAMVAARVSAADTLAIAYLNATAAANVPSAGVHNVVAVRS